MSGRLQSGASSVRLRDRIAGTITSWMRLPWSVRALLPAAIMAALWWSSSRVPQQQAASIVRVLLHNSMHVVAYGLLGAACWLAWSARRAVPTHVQAWWSWLLASLYGVVDELHQSFVPGRVCSVADLGTDVSSAALAVALLSAIVDARARWWRVAAIASLAASGSVLLATFTGW